MKRKNNPDRPPQPEQRHEAFKTCIRCGKPFVHDEQAAAAHHVKEGGEIDECRDHDHSPYSKDEVPF